MRQANENDGGGEGEGEGSDDEGGDGDDADRKETTTKRHAKAMVVKAMGMMARGGRRQKGNLNTNITAHHQPLL